MNKSIGTKEVEHLDGYLLYPISDFIIPPSELISNPYYIQIPIAFGNTKKTLHGFHSWFEIRGELLYIVGNTELSTSMTRATLVKNDAGDIVWPRHIIHQGLPDNIIAATVHPVVIFTLSPDISIKAGKRMSNPAEIKYEVEVTGIEFHHKTGLSKTMILAREITSCLNL